MAVCFAADFKRNNGKVFRFPSNTKDNKNWEVSIYKILIRQKEMAHMRYREPHGVIWKWASAT